MIRNTFAFQATAAALVGACTITFSTDRAEAQNVGLAPSYGTVSLVSGFAPDPYTVSVRAGGSTHASISDKTGTCDGYVAEAPDFRLIYTQGQYVLNFHVRSPSDTILLLNAPDGTWYCSDDFEGLNPAVLFDPPRSGQYDIWVGTYDPGNLPNATLYITESNPPFN